ncbi:MAG TPA: GNAT family N-acetyltransferase [Mucilaginibacter sp.]|jgi:ribosomal-protein-alanine N-acetyltransferase
MQQQIPPQFPTLITERLILRKLEKNDAPEIFKLRSDDLVNQYIDRPKAIMLTEAVEFIHKIETGVNNGECFYWAISLRDDSKLIGTICLWNIEKESCRAEVGYELQPGFQGKGLMQEALSEIIDYGFNVLQFNTLVACSNSANKQSIRLLEKFNFNRDAVLENEYYNKEGSVKDIIYSLKKPGFR